VSIKLAEEGASVAVLDVNVEAAREVADSIVKAGGTAIALRVDVADEGQWRVPSARRNQLRRLDTVIANAGIMLFGRDTVAADLDLQTCNSALM